MNLDQEDIDDYGARGASGCIEGVILDKVRLGDNTAGLSIHIEGMSSGPFVLRP